MRQPARSKPIRIRPIPAKNSAAVFSRRLWKVARHSVRLFLQSLPMGLNTEMIRRAISFGDFSECAQIRTTCHPALRSFRLTMRSRIELRLIFSCQYCRFVCGIRQCDLQPCQKHPSTKRATRAWRKTKSGLPTRAAPRRQPVMPFARKIEINFNSVALLPCDRIADITSDLCAFVITSGIQNENYPENFVAVERLWFLILRIPRNYFANSKGWTADVRGCAALNDPPTPRGSVLISDLGSAAVREASAAAV